jgi:hypothetical protein
VGELLDAATHEERLLILRHYVEVIELHATDAKGGTYALRLFPEVRPDRGFDFDSSDERERDPENTNGADFPQETDSAVLTGSSLVRPIDEKTPPKEPLS